MPGAFDKDSATTRRVLGTDNTGVELDGQVRNMVWDVATLTWIRLTGDVDPRIENVYDGSGNLIYQGKANAGTATSAAAWMVKKLSYDGSGNLLRIQLAGGSDARTNIFDNYLSLTYS